MQTTYLIQIILLFAVCLSCECSLKYEKLLHEDLLGNYIRDVRPEAEHDDPVHVKYDMILSALNSLDVKQQVLDINTLITMSWYDPQLRWNVSDFDGIKEITIGSEFLWTPDIVLYNKKNELHKTLTSSNISANDRKYFHVEIYRTKVLARNSGVVVWNAPVTWKVSCSCDVTWFPFDEQICTMEFGSWTYTHSQIALDFKEGANTQEHFLGDKFLVSNGEWKITLVKMHQEDEYFQCCTEAFSTIVYEVHLSRMSLYYMLYILLPLFSLVILFLLVFHLGDGERVGFGITVLLSITVYLLVISEKLPEKSDTYPLIGVCFVAEFYFLCIGLAIASFNMSLSQRTENRPPRFLRRLTSWYNQLSFFPGRKSTNDHHELIPMAEDKNGNTEGVVEVSKATAAKKYEEEGVSIEQEWRAVSRFLDVCSTLVFLVIIFITPVIVASLI